MSQSPSSWLTQSLAHGLELLEPRLEFLELLCDLSRPRPELSVRHLDFSGPRPEHSVRRLELSAPDRARL